MDNIHRRRGSNSCSTYARKVLLLIHLAAQYGGGGHPLASGASVHSWEEADEVIAEVKTIMCIKNGRRDCIDTCLSASSNWRRSFAWNY